MRRLVKTTVYMSESVKERVERVAARERRTEADVIRAALTAYVAERQRPRLPLAG